MVWESRVGKFFTPRLENVTYLFKISFKNVSSVIACVKGVPRRYTSSRRYGKTVYLLESHDQ